ncbi:MAG: IS21 family transposase [Lachnospiraceae bacterium]|jgi:transposase|nr:IS21 family transposase [Lachnospiraceae bacterium]
MSKEKQILLLYAENYSQRTIAATLKVSRNTVASVIAAAKRAGLQASQIAGMEEKALTALLFPEKELEPVQVMPDYERIHRELLRQGVTLRLLWEEYSDACRETKKPPYMYSQFCKHYGDYVEKNKLTMHVQHKPGDKLMVDWAGTTLSIHDSVTGEESKCYLFVATLPFSMYSYAEACLTMKQEDWINAHVRAFSFFGGTARMLVSDNLKTGVVSHARHDDPVMNRSYQELADHYGTALLPTRVLAPKDKAAVEGTVGQLTSRIIAKLRDKRFFSLAELNRAISRELEVFNDRPFQKKEGSRASVYAEEELPFMKSLPPRPYEFATWKAVTVQLNYHVAVDGQYYSVPYAYARKKVDVRLTNNVVEAFYQGTRICSHRRLHGRAGQYDTNPDHMPENHRLYGEWNAERFKRWAETIGPSAKEVVDRLFASYRVEEQAYKGCLSLLKLADKYSAVRLENACKLALAHVPNPRYKNIRLILEAGQDVSKPSNKKVSDAANSNGYTHLRGAAYYAGGAGDES